MTTVTRRGGWGGGSSNSINAATAPSASDMIKSSFLKGSVSGGNSSSSSSRRFRSFHLIYVLVLTVLIVSAYSTYLLIVLLKQQPSNVNGTTTSGTGSTNGKITTQQQQQQQQQHQEQEHVIMVTGGDGVVTSTSGSSTTTTSTNHNIKSTPPHHHNWKALQEAGLVEQGTELILNGDGFNVIQIGAHFGFEPNDPLGAGIKYILDHATSSVQQRKKVRWTFVEPSPSNMRKLSENLIKYGDMCDMRSINAGVVSDSLMESEKTGMVFYSIRDTIDLDTGYDSISGKIIPHWITELSSFDRSNIMKHSFAMEELGLDLNDYVVETVVKVKGFTELVKEAVGDDEDKSEPPHGPLVVMIDTEGLDCKIVNGISASSKYLPKYLVFEISHCDYKPSVEHLKNMGYDIKGPKRGNIVAVKMN
mmetsp:Transcript_11140/g.20854  ORF Transcript_11140/g.20854 Transcript_11140/m.20854 type:complete len:419 (+) Transcript_11140:181-1437(+)